MALSGRANIGRRVATLVAATRRKVARRQELRERAALWDAVRPALVAARIDLASLEHLWPVTGAAKELASLGDTPELRRADSAFIAQDPVLASRQPYAAGVAEHATRFRGQPPPRPGAAPFDWYAWALAQPDAKSRQPRRAVTG
jgi:hypothetical protein